MSRKTIVRTITASTIKSVNVAFEKGQVVTTENAPITVNGTITDDKAVKEIRKVYGSNAQLVEIIAVNDVYEISVEDFMKHAKKVEVPAPTPTNAE